MRQADRSERTESKRVNSVITESATRTSPRIGEEATSIWWTTAGSLATHSLYCTLTSASVTIVGLSTISGDVADVQFSDLVRIADNPRGFRQKSKRLTD
ncbi:hypothetical protein CRG98_004279 [Punica granatum]|uniref:Uncharacterized protein n=1 Tax=Punica granatum TaxID=22663 RepID=A0A2I0L3Y5_PUNGR|nr:hypothetical protein CRG98_004279 [Punica granatum]